VALSVIVKRPIRVSVGEEIKRTKERKLVVVHVQMKLGRRIMSSMEVEK
jgi:hypothetical protein